MLIDRMIKAVMLDAGVYDELERDTTATTQAFLVVLVVSLISGLGGAIGSIGRPGQALTMLIGAVVGAIIGWLIWSLVSYWVGTTLFQGTATPGELLRTIGFAYTPNILGFFIFIPIIGGLIAFVGSVWSLVAGIVAVRQALDFSTGKAIITVIVGWLILLLVTVVFSVFIAGFFALIR